MSKINWTYILTFTILVIMTMACRKSYTCRCETFEGSIEYVIIDKAKEDEAIEVCDSLIGDELNGEITRRCTISGKYKGPK